jgi:hypothetical protein
MEIIIISPQQNIQNLNIHNKKIIININKNNLFVTILNVNKEKTIYSHNYINKE